MKQMFIIRGIPGSGKSTFAAKLAALLHCEQIEADQYFMHNGVYVFDESKRHDAWRWVRSRTLYELKQGNDVVLSEVFAKEKSMKPFRKLAEEYGYQVTYLIVENRHAGVDVHDVPHDVLKSMRDSFSIKLGREDV